MTDTLSLSLEDVSETTRRELEAIGVQPGSVVYIRKYADTPAERRAAIYQRLIELITNGLSKSAAIRQVAQEIHMTERHVRRILREVSPS